MAPRIYLRGSKEIFLIGVEISAKYCSFISHHVLKLVRIAEALFAIAVINHFCRNS